MRVPPISPVDEPSEEAERREWLEGGLLVQCGPWVRLRLRVKLGATGHAEELVRRRAGWTSAAAGFRVVIQPHAARLPALSKASWASSRTPECPTSQFIRGLAA